MNYDLFYHLGRLIYKIRWVIVLIWIALIASAAPLGSKLTDPFTSMGFNDPSSESAQANQVLNNEIGYNANRYIVIYKSHSMRTTNPKFFADIKKSLANLKKLSLKHEILYPDQNKKQVSKDKHAAYATIVFKDSGEISDQIVAELRSLIKKPANMTMLIGGEKIFLEDTKKQTQLDLYRAEFIATPVAIITLLFVFGSVVAAVLPVILAGVSAFGIMVILYFIGLQISLSVFTLNIALLLGVCLSIDYALFIISRFRDELNISDDIKENIAITETTAGKAIFFSGLAVFASLSALLLFPINILYSVGTGGLVAVAVAVLVAIVLLPAILSILKSHINFLRVGFRKPSTAHRRSLWRHVAEHVVRHPIFYFIGILCLLMFLAYPVKDIKMGISDFRILPKTSNSRQVYELFTSEFGEGGLTPIIILLRSPHGSFLKPMNISYLYDYTRKLKRDPRVNQITSIVTTEPSLTKKEYKMVYSHSSNMSADMKRLLALTTHKNLTTITIISNDSDYSPTTKALINSIRQTSPPDSLTHQVTGGAVKTYDVLNRIYDIFPYALLWVMGFTYLILLILLRSIILPLKAIIMTSLSLCACYGVLVLVIQNGWLHQILAFNAQGIIDINLVIIIFCTLFGISMDYEVFLLTRIKEYYEQTGDNEKSIIYGIDHSSRIITSAAIIVIFLSFSFMSAGVILVKALGLGFAVAAFIDAFLIRTILVPSTMMLLGKWNWYIPKWLDYILPTISFDTSSEEIRRLQAQDEKSNVSKKKRPRT